MEKCYSRTYKLNVGGQIFEVGRATMLNVKGSKMADIMSQHSNLLHQRQPLFFERPRKSFEAILTYHQTGKLHLPPDVCPGEFLEELTFWNISPLDMEACCYHKYLGYIQEQNIISGFLEKRNEKKKILESLSESNNQSRATKLRLRLWTILDNLENTCIAKAYFCLASLVIILAIFATALSTLPEVKQFNGTSGDGELNVPLGATLISTTNPLNVLDLEMAAVGNPNTLLNTPCDNETLLTDSVGNSTVFTSCDFERFSIQFLPEKPHQKVLSIEKALQASSSSSKIYILILIYIEYITNAFFTIELMLRVICCPKIRKNILSIQNIVDFLALTAVYLRVILIHSMDEKYHDRINILLYVQMLRILRLLRVVENVTAFQVLTYSIKTDKKDLLVMLFYVCIGVLFFSNFIYFVEKNVDFPSIPDAWWWSIITMTTVGYGDATPKTALGKIIGALCALSGVLLFSLIIPIFVNTFLSLYQFMNVMEEKAPYKDDIDDNVDDATIVQVK